MKSRPVSIRIAKPCHEDWDQMTPSDRGKFCGSCQKNVTDFSSMTDNEILQFLSEHTGSMCGQLRGSQLNRAIVNTRLSGKNYHLNTIFGALMLAGAAGTVHAQTTLTADHPNVEVSMGYPVPVTEVVATENRTSQKHILTATVIDTITGEAQPFAAVMIAGTTCGAMTDNEGHFTLEIPDSLFTDSITFQVSATGYFREQVIIASKDIASTKKIEVALNEIMMKGDMIIEEVQK